ncbi:MAG: class I SAM-dependent methyltransferase [Oscillospiraceae bacterium]|nr:class I SAM-dependent methyltransferase [Oscillospiraceae bacterium]
MDTNQYLIEYYNRGGEDGRLASRHGSVEFLTSMRYIERYLKSGDRVIEIGAGTGRYSHTLARKGYTVDAVEPVDYNIEVFHQNTHPDEIISIKQGNALNLSDYPDNTYDITLLLGPMYHLFTKEDKQKAISEAIRITKQGGIVFVAYCIVDASILVSGFKRKRFSITEFIEKGYIDPITFAPRSEPALIFEIVRKENIDELMSIFPAQRLHYIATDGYAFHMKDTIDEMDDAEFKLFLKYHYATCEREDMVGLTAHSLDIFRKD